jgi:hypothetical protein
MMETSEAKTMCVTHNKNRSSNINLVTAALLPSGIADLGYDQLRRDEIEFSISQVIRLSAIRFTEKPFYRD